MSKYRIAFLIWWTALVLFIAVVNRDVLPPVTYDSTFFAGLAVVVVALGSWIPGSLLRLVGR
jgi:hypothetical protein